MVTSGGADSPATGARALVCWRAELPSPGTLPVCSIASAPPSRSLHGTVTRILAADGSFVADGAQRDTEAWIAQQPRERLIEQHERTQRQHQRPRERYPKALAEPAHQVGELLRDDSTDEPLAGDLQSGVPHELAQPLLRVAVADVRAVLDGAGIGVLGVQRPVPVERRRQQQ